MLGLRVGPSRAQGEIGKLQVIRRQLPLGNIRLNAEAVEMLEISLLREMRCGAGIPVS